MNNPLSLHIENLGKVSAQHGLSHDEIFSNKELLVPYLEKIHKRNQGFYSVIDDQNIVEQIEHFAGKVKGKYNNIVVLGIGGSALGTICLQQALSHYYENEKSERTFPKLHVIDNIDPQLIADLESIITLETTLFIVVTKSGGTPETLSQYMYFRKKCEDQQLSIKDHFVFITDPKKGLLREVAEKEVIPTFPIPENVGGRFSVLTAVGLLPAKLIGIDITSLLQGAQEVRDLFLDKNMETNLPFQLATIQYLMNEKGKSMHVLFPYAQKLYRFADWYRQLLAESIGKAKNESGETVNVGITPLVALGATDQHSQNQLYNEGPNDKFFLFLEVKNLGRTLAIPNTHPQSERTEYLSHTSFNELLSTEKQGTELSLTENNRPNITITIEQLNAHALGQLFLLFEGATAFLGEYYHINAFDQPGVERSKQITKDILLRKHS